MFFRNQNHYKEEAYLAINYKSLKKKPKWMINSDLLFVYILMLSFDPVLSQHQVQTCAPATQQSIFNSLPQCESRTTLVDLRQYFDNNHDVIQVCTHIVHLYLYLVKVSMYVESRHKLNHFPIQVRQKFCLLCSYVTFFELANLILCLLTVYLLKYGVCHGLLGRNRQGNYAKEVQISAKSAEI